MKNWGGGGAIGLVIDDAIVVVENIVMHRDSGEHRSEAVRKALKVHPDFPHLFNNLSFYINRKLGSIVAPTYGNQPMPVAPAAA